MRRTPLPDDGTPLPWITWERCLLFLYLLGKSLMLFTHLGESIGWDSGAHIEIVSLWKISDPVLPVSAHFYGYHPPIAFLLARSIHLMGVSVPVSIQLVAFASSITAFFAVRATLKKLNLLDKPLSIAFLYLAFSLPLQQYLARSINFDVVIFAVTCVVLYLSVRLFWDRRRENWLLRWTHAVTGRPHPEEGLHPGIGLLTALCIGLLTKFTGILVLALPPIVAALAPDADGKRILERWTAPKVRLALFLSALAVCVTLPYYLTRYYAETGTVLPNNIDVLFPADAEHNRAERDREGIGFFVQYFFVTHPDTIAVDVRDQSHERFSNGWKDLWSGHKNNVFQTPLSHAMSRIYAWAGGVLLAISFFLLRRKRAPDAWARFGSVVLWFSLLQLLALFAIAYKYTIPVGFATKAVYIPPLLLGIAYLLTLVAEAALPRSPRARVVGLHALLALTGAFLVANHVLPVY